MKFQLFRVITAIALLFMQLGTGLLYAQSGIESYEIERVGQTGWQFLKLNGDARQAALGNAYTALSGGDANAVFGNPAALVGVKDIDVAINRTNWIADIGYQSAAVVKNFEGIGIFGISIANIDYGDIPETINSPIVGEDRTEAVVTGNMFTATDIAIGITYTRSITDRLSVGGNIRWLRESMADVSMNNISMDIGTLFYTGFRSLRIAFSARNFGPDSHFLGFNEELQSEPQDIKMPLDFRLGLAMDFLDEPGSKNLLVVSVDGNHPNDGPEKFRVGAEYTFNKMFSLRCGYKFNYDEESFTFGAGFEYPVYDYKLSVHYAYIEFGILTQVHMFSVGFSL